MSSSRTRFSGMGNQRTDSSLTRVERSQLHLAIMISTFLKDDPDTKHAKQASVTLLRLRQFLSARTTDSQKRGGQMVDDFRKKQKKEIITRN